MGGDQHRLLPLARSLPDKPGIYFFLGRDKQVLYIGKARSLADRVRTYFLPTSDSKVHNILAEALDIDYILTDSEREAAFLENNFIQQYQPKYNERLKDDKSFPYLKLTMQEPYPGIYLTRRVEEDGARYFGPYSPAHQARKTIHLINRHFGIRDCREAIPSKRSRPCLQYDLGLCAAPCTGLITGKEYLERSGNALLFLEGKVEELLRIVRLHMFQASKQQRFEAAARWRDLLFTLEQIKEKPRFISSRIEDKDIFGYTGDDEGAAVFVFIMRSGKVIQSKGLRGMRPEGQTDQALLTAKVLSFYRQRGEVPGTILLPPFLEDGGEEDLKTALTDLRGGRVILRFPRRGKDRRLVELADRNASLLLKRERGSEDPLTGLQRMLGLPGLPRIIEGYDISNTGGQESVGSRVVFRYGLPDKPSYRKYRIRSVEGPHDTASLQEVLQRRFSNLARDDEDRPDLVLVDGGKGQLNAARTALESLGWGDLSLVSLAKREEILFSLRFPQGLRLERNSEALRLLQSIRDEAHRFAVTYHRRRRTRKSFASLLDGIPGIGPQRKKILLTHFPGLDAIRAASREEIAALIGRRAAAALHSTLRDQMKKREP